MIFKWSIVRNIVLFTCTWAIRNNSYIKILIVLYYVNLLWNIYLMFWSIGVKTKGGSNDLGYVGQHFLPNS